MQWIDGEYAHDVRAQRQNTVQARKGESERGRYNFNRSASSFRFETEFSPVRDYWSFSWQRNIRERMLDTCDRELILCPSTVVFSPWKLEGQGWPAAFRCQGPCRLAPQHLQNLPEARKKRTHPLQLRTARRCPRPAPTPST